MAGNRRKLAQRGDGDVPAVELEPGPENITDVGLDYQGVIRAGGRDTTQDFIQDRLSLCNDLSRFVTWRGSHTKAGAVLSVLSYDVTKLLFGNPVFRFRSDESFAIPFEASYGVGNPDLSTDKTQFGFFVQDDWNVGSRVTINAGLRWDYESDMLNNDYVTPEDVRAATAPFVDPARYFTDGDDRPPFYGAWQPRVGLSYDLTGAGRHVLFAGYGRYYDRVYYNAGLDERFRLQYGVRTFRFSLDGSPRDGQETIVWDPAYLSRAGLDGLIARGVAPNPEVFLIDNETKPPVSDQFNAGIRSSVAGILLSANYAGVRARNGSRFCSATAGSTDRAASRFPGSATSWSRATTRRTGSMRSTWSPSGRSTAAGGSASTTRSGRPKPSAASCSASITRRSKPIHAIRRRPTSGIASSRPASSACPPASC